MYKKPEELNVNPLGFINCKTKYHAYFMGLLWADGYVYPKGGNRVELIMVKKDFDDIRDISDKLGKWCKLTKNYQRSDGIKRQKQEGICTGNKMLCNFLCDNDYNEKSLKSADKILKIIPKKWHKYWYRGYYDGDGYCYYKKKQCCQLGFGGSYDQNWNFLEQLMIGLDIKYKIKQYISPKGHKSSTLRATKQTDVLKFFKFIYDKYDDIGLSRKYDKYQEILE